MTRVLSNGGGEDSPPPPPPPPPSPKHSSFPPKFLTIIQLYNKSSVACPPVCFVYALSGRLMLHYIAFPYYDLKIVSECLRTTLRRLKIPGGYAPRSPYKLHLWNVVEGLPGGGLDSRMTVTCIDTNFPYYDLKIVSEYLRNNLRSLIIPKFSGGGVGMPPDPLQNAAAVPRRP